MKEFWVKNKTKEGTKACDCGRIIDELKSGLENSKIEYSAAVDLIISRDEDLCALREKIAQKEEKITSLVEIIERQCDVILKLLTEKREALEHMLKRDL